MAKKLSRQAIASYVASELLVQKSHKTLVQQLAAYLIESRRTNELSLIMRDVAVNLADKGYVLGEITTAHALSEETKSAIVEYAKKRTGAAKIHLDTAVEPALLGGMKLTIPGKELNTTVARSLNILKTEYKKA